MIFDLIKIRVPVVPVEEMGALVLMTVTGKDEVDAIILENWQI